MRACLAVTIQLQAARADRADDGRVVHDAHLDAQRARAQLQVRVRGGPGARLRGLRQRPTRQCSSTFTSGTLSMACAATRKHREVRGVCRLTPSHEAVHGKQRASCIICGIQKASVAALVFPRKQAAVRA